MHEPAAAGPSITGVEANIWKYYLFQALVGLQLWYPIWVIYLVEERGLSLTQVTIVEVPFWVASVLVQVPAAAMADRWGRKPMLVASAASLACATILFGVATTYPLLLLSYVIWGAGFAFLYGTESAFIFDSLKASGREQEYTSIYGRGWGVSTAAILAGTLLGAPIADATSLPFPIIVSGGIVALAALVALTFSEPAPEGGAELPASYGQIIRDSARMLRENRAITYPILFYGVITVGYIAPFFFFQPFLIEHGVDVGDVGFWQTPTRLAGVAGALTAAWILTNLGERIAFWSMPLLLIGALGLLAAWDSKWAVAAFPVIFYVVILSQPAVTDYLNRRVPTEKRATVLSMTSLMRSLVIIPAAPLFGVIADEWSVETTFLTHAVLLAALAVPLLILWNRHLGIRGETGAIMVEPAGSE